MLLLTNPQQARDRVSRTFFSRLDDALPEQFGADALHRARALGDAVYTAVLEEYALPASTADDDEIDICNGAD